MTSISPDKRTCNESLQRPDGENVVISLRKVTRSYALGKSGTVTAVHDVNLDVARGDFVVITGRSGSGKTTLLNLAAGLTRPTSGDVLLGGVNLWTLADREQSLMRNQKIGFAFQFPSLLPSLTVLENVALPAMFGPAERRAGALERASGLLAEVGLSDKVHAYPRQLSAGQYKRTVIARSLVNQPEMIFADEPTSDLDEQTEREFMAFLRGIHETAGLTVLLVTHNRDLIPFGTRSLEMAGGRILGY